MTGASRGIGKGIALELGAAGATVYLTARTVDAGPIPDVLVNNVYSAPDLARWLGRPFWELPLEAWDEVIDIGVRSHYVAAALGTPLMLEQGSGLIVNVSSSGAIQYAHTVTYGVGKAALDKMTADMAHELTPHGVGVVSLWPGLVRTEVVLLGARTTDDGRQVLDLPGEGTFDLADAESPRFSGRAVVALATDPDVLSRTGRAWTVADLASAYGFTDVDGSLPRVQLRPDS